MKFAFLASILFLITACGGSKKHTIESAQAVEQQEANNGYSTGRVTTSFAGDACPWLVKLDGVSGTYLIPIAMDERYRKNGLHLRFTYRASRANNGGCMKGQTAILEDITLIEEK
ncbi:MAG TPA: hypothetical protein PK760_08000 [Flavobacteriales bacterium]|nr:hypothetical protein [Flavobacteriales bacterium]